MVRAAAGGAGPDVVDEAVLADVARRYYLQDQSKVDVAAALGLSRFKVARLLQQARDTGVVTIHVRVPGGQDELLSRELAGALGVRRCVVVGPGSGRPTAASSRHAVAEAAAVVLPELISAGDRVGLAWSRTVDATVDRLGRLPRSTLVQLVGTLHQSPTGGGTAELVRRASALTGGVWHPINAPLLVDSAEGAAMLRRQPGIRDTLSMADDLDVAVVAVGAWRSGCSTVWDAVGTEIRREGSEAGAVAEVCGRLLADDGSAVVTELDLMVVGATVAQLRAARERVAVVVGPHRAAATVAAVRGGLVSTLVTTTTLAREVLRLPDLPGGPPRTPSRG